MTLIMAPNLADPDGVYALLLAAHKGRGAQESAAINARLVLILANHIGERAVIEAAIALALRA